MMDCTDRHDRYFLRLISPDALLYSEMITAKAIHYGDKQRLLGFNHAEHPVVLQLGGSEPDLLAEAAKIGEDFGYDEINLNVGCPSPRVSSGNFGACLMHEPELVARCVAAMSDNVSIPVTVKTRIGVDDKDSYEELCEFIDIVKESGCETFIMHARKAWLEGLSPKENREIPPLRYDVVARMKNDYPQLEIIVNGGIKTLADVKQHLAWADGVMIGREAYSNPYLLAELQAELFAQKDIPSRHEVVQKLLPYVQLQLEQGIKLSAITRHIVGLFQKVPGAAKWRRYISEHAHKSGAGVEVVEQALANIL